MYEERVTREQPIIIGIDHGFSSMKCGSGIIFSNGIIRTEGKPPEMKGSIYYDGAYYSVGGKRMTVVEDKTSNENYFILTLVAIAKELTARGLSRTAKVILGVGVPFKRFAFENVPFTKYLKRSGTIYYEFEGEEFEIVIENVYCYPQCFAAIASRIGNMKGRYVVADIGSWTKDIVSIQDGRVMVDQSVTISHSMISLFQDIIDDVNAKIGGRIPEDVIQNYLLKKEVILKPGTAPIIDKHMKQFAEQTEGQLIENGFDIDYSNIIYVGGGSVIMSRYAKDRENVTYLEDISLNAKGYELLVNNQLGRR